jgi:hypothetical protein
MVATATVLCIPYYRGTCVAGVDDSVRHPLAHIMQGSSL